MGVNGQQRRVLVPPKIIGSLHLPLPSFINIGMESFLMVDWERLGSQLLLGLNRSFSKVARILQISRLASWMYVMCGAISIGSMSYVVPLRPATSQSSSNAWNSCKLTSITCAIAWQRLRLQEGNRLSQRFQLK
jgi:hypothetical protein